MLFRITFLALFGSLNAFFLKEDENILQHVDFNSSLSKGVDLEQSYDIFGSDSCSCKNGRCVKDNRGKWKCMCNPKHSLQGKDCELCDCGKQGKCIFKEIFSEETRRIQYEKQCVCDTGFADKYGKCTECICGINSKCEFEYGEKNCYCMEGYAELKGVCTECNCGEGGYCEFLNGEKICTCYNGFLFDGNICREGCYSNDDCEDRQKCVDESEDWKICQCADGLSGSNCDEEEWCEDGGKFAHCSGANGTCVYIKEKRSVGCTCPYYKKLHPEENRCKETCKSEFECHNHGVCEEKGGHKFCSCKPGLIGDTCETVFDCTHEGKYKNCESSGGTCFYDFYESRCECPPGNKIFNNKTLMCEVCDCSVNGKCRFIDGIKKCDCAKGFVENSGTCKEGCYEDDDCEDYQKCSAEASDWKTCQCADGLSGRYCDKMEWCESYGKFKDCNGLNGTCEYDRSRRSVECICSDEKALDPIQNICRDTCATSEDCMNGGICKNGFCKCKPGLIGDRCETIFDCLPEGKYKGCTGSGGECTFDGTAAVCTCPPNQKYNEAEHRCRDCDCGQNGGCGFEYGRKKCFCDFGFADKNGICTETCAKDNDCNSRQTCKEIKDWKRCVCADGLSGVNCERMGWCEGDGQFSNCNGGANGTCVYDGHGRSVTCICQPEKKFNPAEKRCTDTCTNKKDCLNGGECKENFCICKPGLIGDKCGTIFDCTEDGKFKGCKGDGVSCMFNGNEAVCNCPVKQKYNRKEHVCKDCDCGLNGRCEFENGQKKCLCDIGFAVKDGICTETCAKDEDCNTRQVCWKVNDWKRCICANGLGGDNCERMDRCEGKFKNCKGVNGTCLYDEEWRTVVCNCTAGKELHPTENRCRDTCYGDNDCWNGAKCMEKFCSCKPGLFGDLCETVFDCTSEGKYKNCERSGGKCYFDGNKAICGCPVNKILHEKELICKVCDCGENGQCSFRGEKQSRKWSEKYPAKNRKCEKCYCGDHGSCAFEYEEKICHCNKGYSEKKGKCEICDCGANGFCAFEGNEKVCKCHAGYSENDGKCESCDCGEGGWCVFKNGEKTCECGNRFSEKDGKCENCDCGTHGSCYFVDEEKMCKCEDGYAEINGRCEVCSCGKNTVCRFIYGAKACVCIEGYTFNEVTGECEECDCGSHGTCGFLDGIKACLCEKGFSEDFGECKKCDCGEATANCSFVRGQKNCTCKVGYAEENAQCKKIKSCKQNPCVNGHCVMREKDFLCVCDDPFTGRYCEISSCIETKCLGGRCRVVGKKEECMCPSGHKLSNGTCTKTFCVEKKCYDGECVIENGVETCICPDGYVSEGNECRKVKCSKKSCIGGTCRIIRGNIEECVCPTGHVLIGDTCTITTCTPRTCYGGRCEKRDGELVCICPDGFHLEGVGCIETQCKEQNCFGGKCRVINEKEICTCLEGHVLKNDQCQKVRCVVKNCFGGKCDVVDDEEVCSCPVGFEVQGDVCREI